MNMYVLAVQTHRLRNKAPHKCSEKSHYASGCVVCILREICLVCQVPTRHVTEILLFSLMHLILFFVSGMILCSSCRISRLDGNCETTAGKREKQTQVAAKSNYAVLPLLQNHC